LMVPRGPILQLPSLLAGVELGSVRSQFARKRQEREQAMDLGSVSSTDSKLAKQQLPIGTSTCGGDGFAHACHCS
jgi:hypothetical protein